MPIYEYECRKCHHRFERIQKFSDHPLKKCPECGAGRLEKLLSPPAVHFKGTGWYVTDYGRKGSAGGAGKKDREEKSGGESDKKASAGDSSGKSDSAKKPKKKD